VVGAARNYLDRGGFYAARRAMYCIHVHVPYRQLPYVVWLHFRALSDNTYYTHFKCYGVIIILL
jgi:hypothetical protein